MANNNKDEKGSSPQPPTPGKDAVVPAPAGEGDNVKKQQPKNGRGGRKGGGKGKRRGGRGEEEIPGPHGTQFFRDWMEELRTKVEGALPNLPDRKALVEACVAVDKTGTALKKAGNAREHAKKQKPVDEEALSEARANADAAQKKFDEANLAVEEMSAEMLKVIDDSHLLSSDFDDKDLLRYTAFKMAGINRLAKWCSEGERHEQRASELISFFKSDDNVDLLRQFLASGDGPRGDEYGRAIEIYNQIVAAEKEEEGGAAGIDGDPALRRLAIAVALEWSDGSHSKVIDPLVERYQHYKRAYLDGELDPSFSQLTVWEMRFVVDSDISGDELEWGRKCLRNYRPDLVLSPNKQWRYTEIVRTDVSYKKPEWTGPDNRYAQILAGGGKCGPRAWYGRFITKAFGIPTWGCRQPGHAAMARWTNDGGGWTMCLGGGMHKSFWEHKSGNYFLMEARARSELGSDEEYARQILRIEWIGRFHGENHGPIPRNCFPCHKFPWHTLAFMKLKKVAAQCKSCRCLHERTGPETKLEALSKESEVCEAILKDGAVDGCVVVPAACCTSPKKNNRGVHFHKSFSGGRQVFLSKKGELQYTIGSEFLPETTPKYKFSCRVCTVHRNEKPMRLKVGSDDGDGMTYEIPMKYTMGLWEDTEPVSIEIRPGSSETKLTLTRQTPSFGISIKCIKLSPA